MTTLYAMLGKALRVFYPLPLYFFLAASTAVGQAAPEGNQAAIAQTIAPATDPTCARFLQIVEQDTDKKAGLEKLRALAAQTPCSSTSTLADKIKFMNGILNQSFDDPYTFIMTPENADAVRKESDGATASFEGGGVGVELGDQQVTSPQSLPFNGRLWSVNLRGPAYAAGVRDTDQLVKVDGLDVIGKTFDDVIKLNRGPVKTWVTLTVRRHGQLKDFRFQRQTINNIPVSVTHLANGIVLIRLSTFGDNAVPELLHRAIADTVFEARGYIVDIRNNPGGWTDAGIGGAESFIPEGNVVSELQRDYNKNITVDPAKMTFRKYSWDLDAKHLWFSESDQDGSNHQAHPQSRQPYLLAGRPVVLLVNGHTASSGEIFSSALRQNRLTPKKNGVDDPEGACAVLIGTQTFGKGIGQTVTDGPEGTKVRATSFRYFTPHKNWLGDAHKNKIGLHPDIVVGLPDGAQWYGPADTQLQAGVKYLNDRLAVATALAGK